MMGATNLSDYNCTLINPFLLFCLHQTCNIPQFKSHAVHWKEFQWFARYDLQADRHKEISSCNYSIVLIPMFCKCSQSIKSSKRHAFISKSGCISSQQDESLIEPKFFCAANNRFGIFHRSIPPQYVHKKSNNLQDIICSLK